MKNFITATALLITTLTLSSCILGTDDEGSSGGAVGVSMNDFTVTPTPTDKRDVEDEIKLSDSFYDNPPPSNSFNMGGMDPDSCIQAKTSTIKPVKDANGYYVLALSNFDYAECMKDNPMFTVNKMNMNMVMKMKGTDLAGNEYDFSKLAIASEPDFDLEVTQGEMHAEMFMTTSMTFGEATMEAEFKGLLSDAAGQGTTCKLGMYGVMQNCVDRTVTKSSGSFQGNPINEIATEKLHYKNLTASKDGRYYTGGTIDFSYNNWNGTMTYDAADPAKAPTYSATNGTETITGTHGSSFSFKKSASGLVSSAIQNHIRSILGN